MSLLIHVSKEHTALNCGICRYCSCDDSGSDKNTALWKRHHHSSFSNPKAANERLRTSRLKDLISREWMNGVGNDVVIDAQWYCRHDSNKCVANHGHRVSVRSKNKFHSENDINLLNLCDSDLQWLVVKEVRAVCARLWAYTSCFRYQINQQYTDHIKNLKMHGVLFLYIRSNPIYRMFQSSKRVFSLLQVIQYYVYDLGHLYCRYDGAKPLTEPMLT